MADLMFIFLESATLLVLNEQLFFLFGQIQTSQTGGHPYSDTSPYGECSLVPKVIASDTSGQSYKASLELRYNC